MQLKKIRFVKRLKCFICIVGNILNMNKKFYGTKNVNYFTFIFNFYFKSSIWFYLEINMLLRSSFVIIY